LYSVKVTKSKAANKEIKKIRTNLIFSFEIFNGR
jgi:hypothetical protein